LCRPTRPSLRRGRWAEVTDLSRIYDRGQPWCVNVAGHSDHNGDYPDARHAQGHECHSREAFVDRAAAIWTSRAGPAYRSRCVSGWSAKGSGSTYGRAGAPPVRLAAWGAGALGGALRGRWAAQRFVRRAALVRRHDQSHSQVGTCGLTRRVERSDLPSSQAMGPRHTCCRTRPREGAPGPTSQAARYLGASNPRFVARSAFTLGGFSIFTSQPACRLITDETSRIRPTPLSRRPEASITTLLRFRRKSMILGMIFLRSPN
jgi:hypothetical protein